ncbi:MAG: hypothetical protein ACJAUR_001255 [Ulvibacter sp.]
MLFVGAVVVFIQATRQQEKPPKVRLISDLLKKIKRKNCSL